MRSHGNLKTQYLYYQHDYEHKLLQYFKLPSWTSNHKVKRPFAHLDTLEHVTD